MFPAGPTSAEAGYPRKDKEFWGWVGRGFYNRPRPPRVIAKCPLCEKSRPGAKHVRKCLKYLVQYAEYCIETEHSFGRTDTETIRFWQGMMYNAKRWRKALKTRL